MPASPSNLCIGCNVILRITLKYSCKRKLQNPSSTDCIEQKFEFCISSHFIFFLFFATYNYTFWGVWLIYIAETFLCLFRRVNITQTPSGWPELQESLINSNGCLIWFLDPQKSLKPQFIFLNFSDKENSKE